MAEPHSPNEPFKMINTDFEFTKIDNFNNEVGK